MTEPKTEIIDIPPQSAADAVQKMVEAFELSKTATGYQKTKGDGRDFILCNGGKDKAENPTLYRYIEKAEKAVIQERQQEIIEKAGSMIENEIDKIQGLLR